ncbi:MAG: MotA/TolQ/ExbB proton channel family protein [Deltaproteobacteria bacterium]|nr:MotA/TolQ/ExbB proton channel family protein [Deltaproteobacteria bacterium]
MLLQLLQGFTLLGEEWVLWILIALSVLSVAVMIERLVFFLSHSLSGVDALSERLTEGDVEFARRAVEGKRGMEAAVVRGALNATDKGPESVDEVIASTMARERIRYESWLSILGTLGNNAPFIGLFGTVLGIIRAFHDLANASPAAKAGGAGAVMSGISGALVATAVGLAVAIPAVVAYNFFQRWLKRLSSSATSLSHAWQGHLKAVREDDLKKAA